MKSEMVELRILNRQLGKAIDKCFIHYVKKDGLDGKAASVKCQELVTEHLIVGPVVATPEKGSKPKK